jgi:hypothetical protein
MTKRARALVAGFVLLASACGGAAEPSNRATPTGTSGGEPTASTPTPSLSASPTSTPATGGSTALCERPGVSEEAPGADAEELPAAIAQVADEVEELRGLEFKRPVDPEAVSREEINRRIQASLERSLPVELMSRRGRAWSAIGAVPAQTDLRQAYVDFAGSQFIGFYDTITHEIVFIGTDSPTPYQRQTLAHELTHALDDQHFDLSRLDVLESQCRDEELAAFIALAEGNARVHEALWTFENLTADELAELAAEAGMFSGPPATVPPFVSRLIVFPYPNGELFVQSLLAAGGKEAVNEAFSEPPVSTEQILHPERYPDDEPQELAVPDLTRELGQGWELTDQLDVGEAWLLTLLSLRLSESEARDAADGWDGGRYRAWTRVEETAVLMETVWDDDADAGQFAEAIERFVEGAAASVVHEDASVRVLFATSDETLTALESAAA